MNQLTPMPHNLAHDADAWAIRINASWRRSLESVIETGRLLIDAKAQLVHGQWESMVPSLDFSPSVAQRLMAIARDNRLTNPAHVQFLPRSYGTLYELTRLSDDEFATGLDKGIIGPDMERADVALLRVRPEHSIDKVSTEPLDRQPPTDTGEPPAYEGLTAPHAEIDPDGDARFDGGSPVSMPGGARAIAPSRVEPADSLDFFPTPPWATRALLEHTFRHLDHLKFCKFQKAWEPACGEGHMAVPLREYFRDVRATDLADYGYGDGELDFLTCTDASAGADWIITNPPFGDTTEAFVHQALKLAGTGVAMFVRLQWLETVGRYERLFKIKPPTLISFFAERVPLHKERWEPDGDTLTAYIWLVWIKGAEPRAPFWIPPGCRESLSKREDIKKFGKAIVEGEAA